MLKIEGKPLPAEFFCGVGYVRGSIGESALNTIDRNRIGWIPQRVVATIYRFKEYPDGYVDPLDESRPFTQRELAKLWLLMDRGVHDYNIFREHFSPREKSVSQKKELIKT